MKKSTCAWRAATLAALGCLLLASPVLAQEEEENDVFQLGTVTFSVNVQGERFSVGEQMETSVTRTDIEKFEKKDIATALGRMPGVRYVAPSGRGRASGRYDSGVVVRGFEAFGRRNATLPVFIDGIPVYIPYENGLDMGRFTTNGVSAISVYKGYSSVLFGPNTMGGVINIVSSRPTKPLSGNFVLGAGDGETAEVGGIFGTLQEKWYTQGGYSYFNREFIRAADDFSGKDAAGQEKNTDRKNYATRDRKMEFKLGYTPNATDEYVVSYLNQSARKGPRRDAAGYIEDSEWEWPNWDRQTVSFVSNTKFNNFYIRPRVFYDKYDNGMLQPSASGFALSLYDDYAWGGSMEAGWNIAEKNTLKGKFDYKYNQHNRFDFSNTNPADNNQAELSQAPLKYDEQIFFFALEDTYRFNEQWEVQAGLIYSRQQSLFDVDAEYIADLNSKFPGANIDPKPGSIDSLDPEAVLFYHLNKKHSFHYSIAKKIRYPSMYNQLSTNSSGNYVTDDRCPAADHRCLRMKLPTTDLKPEKALHHEIGWTGKFFDRLDIDLEWYYSTTNDAVTLMSTYKGFNFTDYPGYAIDRTINIPGDTHRQGFDLGVTYNITDRISIGKSFSYLHTGNDDHEWRSTQPAYNGSLYASIGLNAWAVLIPALDYHGRSRVQSTGDDRWNFHQGYALVDLKLSITPPMHRNISFNVGVENLFNKDYRGWANISSNNFRDRYPSAGRYVYANARYSL